MQVGKLNIDHSIGRTDSWRIENIFRKNIEERLEKKKQGFELGKWPKTGIPGPVFLKNGYSLKPSKTHPTSHHANDCGQKRIQPVISPFLRDNRPQVFAGG